MKSSDPTQGRPDSAPVGRPQPAPKPLGRFVVHAIALTLLIGFWPTPRDVFPALFHAQANAVFALLPGPSVELRTPDPASGIPTDTLLVGAPRPGAPPAWTSWFSVRRIAWWPAAALVAMLLATPLRPGRRTLAIAGGLALLDALTLGRIGVEIAYASYELVHGPGEPARGIAHLLLRTGSEALTATIPSAAFVFVTWAAVASPWRTIDLSAARALVGMPQRPRVGSGDTRHGRNQG